MVPLKMGMVGGGLDALVGAWHRSAVAIDGGIELVAGALASAREHRCQRRQVDFEEEVLGRFC